MWATNVWSNHTYNNKCEYEVHSLCDQPICVGIISPHVAWSVTNINIFYIHYRIYLFFHKLHHTFHTVRYVCNKLVILLGVIPLVLSFVTNFASGTCCVTDGKRVRHCWEDYDLFLFWNRWKCFGLSTDTTKACWLIKQWILKKTITSSRLIN